MQQTVRVAAVQAEPAWLDLAAGVDKVISLIGEAAAGGARLVQSVTVKGSSRASGAWLFGPCTPFQTRAWCPSPAAW